VSDDEVFDELYFESLFLTAFDLLPDSALQLLIDDLALPDYSILEANPEHADSRLESIFLGRRGMEVLDRDET